MKTKVSRPSDSKTAVLSHVDGSGQPRMVNVSDKLVTARKARAQASLTLPLAIRKLLKDGEILMPKGPVFQTAILAGTMGAKRTSDLIPLCHPLPLTGIHIAIKAQPKTGQIFIESEVTCTDRTGVEMEALTAVSIAALTVYDMLKALSHDIIISEIKLLEKRGGKSDILFA